MKKLSMHNISIEFPGVKALEEVGVKVAPIPSKIADLLR